MSPRGQGKPPHPEESERMTEKNLEESEQMTKKNLQSASEIG
jgi:hypothetical protein